MYAFSTEFNRSIRPRQPRVDSIGETDFFRSRRDASSMLIQAVSAALPYFGRKARELIPSKLLRVVVIVPSTSCGSGCSWRPSRLFPSFYTIQHSNGTQAAKKSE